MAKNAETLALEYELGTESTNFYDYIIQTYINGQRQQMKDLFNMMNKHSKSDFLINYLKEDSSYQTSCKNICIDEIIY